LDYEKEIEHYPYLDSERELILRALLSKDIEDSIFINHTPCTTNLPPRSKGSSRRGGGRAVSSHNSVNSDISGTGTGASSVDDNGSRKKEKRQIAKTLLGQDVTRNASQDGDEDDDGRVKRKRRNDEVSVAQLPLRRFQFFTHPFAFNYVGLRGYYVYSSETHRHPVCHSWIKI
jgi:hypothetical protein